jgi:hypothetical protein
MNSLARLFALFETLRQSDSVSLEELNEARALSHKTIKEITHIKKMSLKIRDDIYDYRMCHYSDDDDVEGEPSDLEQADVLDDVRSLVLSYQTTNAKSKLIGAESIGGVQVAVAAVPAQFGDIVVYAEASVGGRSEFRDDNGIEADEPVSPWDYAQVITFHKPDAELLIRGFRAMWPDIFSE